MQAGDFWLRLLVAAGRRSAAQGRWKPPVGGDDWRASVAHHGASNPLRVVTADAGRPYLAEVIGQEGGSERVAPFTAPRGVRTIKAGEVAGHWRTKPRFS